MLRRLRPGIGFCLGIILVILVSELPCGAPHPELYALIPVCALLVSLVGLPAPLAPGRLTRAVALPLAAGALCGALALPPAPTLGLPTRDVRAFGGVALEDSVARASGGMIHRLELVSVEDGQSSAPARGTVRVLSVGDEMLWAGDRVRVSAALADSDPWDRDDFVARAASGRARLVAKAIGPAGLRARIRAALELRVRQMGYPMSGFFLAMFVGDRAGVDPELADLFRASGCLHVLALSGTHLVLVWGLAWLAVRRLPWDRVRRTLPLGVVVVYVALAGPLPSLVRALAMLGVAWAAGILGRETSGVDLLCLALALVLLAEPRMLFDLSLQLSAAAVLGMLSVGAALADRVSPYVPRALALPLCAGVGAQALVAPILLGASGAFQPAGLVSGLAASPLATALLVGGLADIAIPLGWLAPLHAGLGLVLDLLYRWLEAVLRVFASFPQWTSWWGVAATWALLCGWLAARPLARLVRREARA